MNQLPAFWLYVVKLFFLAGGAFALIVSLHRVFGDKLDEE